MPGLISDNALNFAGASFLREIDGVPANGTVEFRPDPEGLYLASDGVVIEPVEVEIDPVTGLFNSYLYASTECSPQGFKYVAHFKRYQQVIRSTAPFTMPVGGPWKLSQLITDIVDIEEDQLSGRLLQYQRIAGAAFGTTTSTTFTPMVTTLGTPTISFAAGAKPVGVLLTAQALVTPSTGNVVVGVFDTTTDEEITSTGAISTAETAPLDWDDIVEPSAGPHTWEVRWKVSNASFAATVAGRIMLAALEL